MESSSSKFHKGGKRQKLDKSITLKFKFYISQSILKPKQNPMKQPSL
ncbi:MAG: hypothetical protein ACK521_09830 [bacterium]